MKHLESKREAIERRRISLMNTGFAKFLEQTSKQVGDIGTPGHSKAVSSSDDSEVRSSNTESQTDTNQTSIPDASQGDWQRKKGASEIVSDKIKITLEYAAEIIRETLELTSGGVVFFDTAIELTEPANKDNNRDLDHDLEALITQMEIAEAASLSVGPSSGPESDSMPTVMAPETASPPAQFRGFRDENRPAKIPAISCSKDAYRRSGILTQRLFISLLIYILREIYGIWIKIAYSLLSTKWMLFTAIPRKPTFPKECDP
jgi:hypothetical protein